MKRVGFASIVLERIEQVVKHGRSLFDDKKYKSGQLVSAAKFCLTLQNSLWPKSWKTSIRDHIRKKSRIDRYIIAGAFLAAEADRENGNTDFDFQVEVERWTVWDKVEEFIKEKEKKYRFYPAGLLLDRLKALVQHSEDKVARADAEKRDLVENMKIYVRSMIMLAENVGMAETHGEKAARLRGMIQFMNKTAAKLNEEHQDDILRSWSSPFSSQSDFPYQGILEKIETQKREIEHLTARLQEYEKPMTLKTA